MIYVFSENYFMIKDEKILDALAIASNLTEFGLVIITFGN